MSDANSPDWSLPISPSLELLRKLFDARLGLPITSHRPAPIGPTLVAMKKLFRAGLQPFINEIFRRQTSFNENLIEVLQALYRDVRSLDAAQWAMKRSLEARIHQLEEALRQSQSAALTARQQSENNGRVPEV